MGNTSDMPPGLQQALAGLPARQQAALALYFGLHQAHARRIPEVAAALGITSVEARDRLHAGAERLRESGLTPVLAAAVAARAINLRQRALAERAAQIPGFAPPQQTTALGLLLARSR